MSSFTEGFINFDDRNMTGLRELNFDIEPVDNLSYFDTFGEVYKMGYGSGDETINANIANWSSGSDGVGAIRGGANANGEVVEMMNYAYPSPMDGISRYHQSYKAEYEHDEHGYDQGYGHRYDHYLMQIQIPEAVEENVQEMAHDLEHDDYYGSVGDDNAIDIQHTNETSSVLSDTVSESETKLSTPGSFNGTTVKPFHLHDLRSLKRVLLVQQLELEYAHSILDSLTHRVTCTHCNDEFESLLLLAEHFDKYKLTTAHKCPFDSCPFFMIGFTRKADLRRHCLTKHFEKGKLTQSINKNIKQVLNNLIYSCKIDNCGKNFYRKDSLQRHLKLVHKNENSKFNKKMKKIQLQKSMVGCHRHAHIAQK